MLLQGRLGEGLAGLSDDFFDPDPTSIDLGKGDYPSPTYNPIPVYNPPIATTRTAAPVNTLPSWLVALLGIAPIVPQAIAATKAGSQYTYGSQQFGLTTNTGGYGGGGYQGGVPGAYAGAPGAGVGRDVGAAAGRIGDQIVGTGLNLITQHPIAAFSVVGLIAYELLQRNRGRR